MDKKAAIFHSTVDLAAFLLPQVSAGSAALFCRYRVCRRSEDRAIFACHGYAWTSLLLLECTLEYVRNSGVCMLLQFIAHSAADDHLADRVSHGGEALLVFRHDVVAHQFLVLVQVEGADEQLPAGSFSLL